LTARLAIALHCFSHYCEKNDLAHPAISSFLDDLWEFPVIDSERWNEWESNHPELVLAALGDKWPQAFGTFLVAHGVGAVEFRTLLQNLVEIVFSSFYGAADDYQSYECLRKVVVITTEDGADLPPLAPFQISLFADRGEWGRQLTVAERDSWRQLKG
jgi:hypothetical protein